jgi:hypothetical protein
LLSELPENEITISSSPVSVMPGMKLLLHGIFKKGPDFAGYVVVTVRLIRREPLAGSTLGKAEDSPSLIVKEPNLPRQGGWFAVKHTFQIPAHIKQMEIQVGGKFKGRVEVKDLALIRKK